MRNAPLTLANMKDEHNMAMSSGLGMTALLRFLSDESSATAIEYALIAGGVAMAIVTVVTAVGSVTTAKFNSAVAAFE